MMNLKFILGTILCLIILLLLIGLFANKKYDVKTELVINAPIEDTWKVLTDFKNMPKWSSSLQNIEGDFRPDGMTTVTFLLQGKEVKPQHKMVGFVEGKSFGWSDPFYLHLFKDNHSYKLEKIDDSHCKIIQSDEIKGIGALYLGSYIQKELLTVYNTFNQELKKEVEKRKQ
ncbi:SRPBCC family protein [Chryseobacterium potabilaquae]|uniref:Polyketide cyclase / dehydrase and lipid transport n=1 Tax=Chryseobacterium potabilaquae TaxID=2675057 RepID=A0A6N4XCF6_9FLAO|nr:SRPBCC family protein [Chryseobacterium potabilaquae]CAA7197141.1 hypothetical protein CHRY9293_03196 [Chryseobacterium potabilaquae]